MPANLNLDSRVTAAEGVAETSTDFDNRVEEALRNGLHSGSNPFGSAAKADTGEATGQVPVLGSGGKLDADLIPEADGATAGVARLASSTDESGDALATPKRVSDLIEDREATSTANSNRGEYNLGLPQSTLTVLVPYEFDPPSPAPDEYIVHLHIDIGGPVPGNPGTRYYSPFSAFIKASLWNGATPSSTAVPGSSFGSGALGLDVLTGTSRGGLVVFYRNTENGKLGLFLAEVSTPTLNPLFPLSPIVVDAIHAVYWS